MRKDYIISFVYLLIIMKRIEIIIPHRTLADVHGMLKDVNVGGMSHYRIEGSGRVKPQPVTAQEELRRHNLNISQGLRWR